MDKRKRRRRSCGEIAWSRARQARRHKKHPVIVGWVFITAFLSVRITSMLPAIPRSSGTGVEWPISDYERGYSTTPKPYRRRYSEQPTMKRLMRDLRRPSARDEATQFLLARVDDVELRGWIIEQIREDQINRLSVHVHAHSDDAAIIASWLAELDAENAAGDEVVSETATKPGSMRKMSKLIPGPPAK